jgi:hypothetical protein
MPRWECQLYDSPLIHKRLCPGAYRRISYSPPPSPPPPPLPPSPNRHWPPGWNHHAHPPKHLAVAMEAELKTEEELAMQRLLNETAAKQQREREALGNTGATDTELDGDWLVCEGSMHAGQAMRELSPFDRT